MTFESELADLFQAWMETVFGEAIPVAIRAFHFNLYDGAFEAEVVGAEEYDPEDDDWACAEDWVGERLRFRFPAALDDQPWEDRLALAHRLIAAGLDGSGAAAQALRSAEAVTVGFVDGDLQVVRAD